MQHPISRRDVICGRIWVMTHDGGAAQHMPLDLPIDYTYAGEQVIAWGP